MSLFEYRMPELGEGLHEGEIVKWHVKPGDQVEEDQLLLDVQNDKSTVEVPSPVTGKVLELKVPEGTVSVIGDVLAVIEVEGEVPASAESSSSDEQAPAQTSSPSPTPAALQDGVKPPNTLEVGDTGATTGQILATPSVRRFAREQGVSLAGIQGTGKNGRITREDVTSAQSGTGSASEAAAPAVTTGETSTAATGAATAGQAIFGAEEVEERLPLRGIRKAIANAMVKSVYTAPHVTIMDEVDVTKLVALRQKAKPLAEKKGVKLTYLPFIVKALVAAMRQFPVMNASIDDDKNEIVMKRYIHVGIATDTENGLIVPVIKHAGHKNIWAIADEIRDLSTRGREGKLQVNELRGSTISITNIGSAGGMFFTPVINHPEVAILGTGRITEKPIVKNGEIAIGQMMALSLSFDHRLIDGATAQHAVNYIKQLLEDPDLLVMEV